MGIIWIPTNTNKRVKPLMHVGKYNSVRLIEMGDGLLFFFANVVVVLGSIVRVLFPWKSKCYSLPLSRNAYLLKSHLINVRVCK